MWVCEGGKIKLNDKFPQPIRVHAEHRKWGKEAFWDAGEATFGMQ